MKKLTRFKVNQMKERRAAGESLQKIADAFKVSKATVQHHTREYGPSGKLNASKVAFREARTSESPVSENSVNTPTESGFPVSENSVNSPAPRPEIPNSQTLTNPETLSQFSVALLELSSVPPEDFQRKAGEVAQLAIALGMQTIEPPRTIRELKTWFDIFRQSTGLDKAPSGGDNGLFRPVKPVRRVVDAEETTGEWEV